MRGITRARVSAYPNNSSAMSGALRTHYSLIVRSRPPSIFLRQTNMRIRGFSPREERRAMARKGTEALSSEGANNGNIEYLFGNNKYNAGGRRHDLLQPCMRPSAPIQSRRTERGIERLIFGVSCVSLALEATFHALTSGYSAHDLRLASL